jgi:hypothetical protein
MLCDHYQFWGMMAVGPVATRINGGKIGQFGYVMLADHVKGGVQHTKFEKELQKARRAKWRGSNICFLHVRPNTYNTDKQGGERPLTGEGAAQRRKRAPNQFMRFVKQRLAQMKASFGVTSQTGHRKRVSEITEEYYQANGRSEAKPKRDGPRPRRGPKRARGGESGGNRRARRDEDEENGEAWSDDEPPIDEDEDAVFEDEDEDEDDIWED